jgi:putative Mg2+ transporter-C (MgtC) family protein
VIGVDAALQIELVVRLLGAAILGAAIGLEREHHGQAAGTRTHLLVALGAAVFTELSAYGFQTGDPDVVVDPTRIAAQIVTGIGFLGAGAIIKYGTSIRGLTTAASLWCAAGIGMAMGAGAWIIAIAGTAIVVISLGPVAWVTRRSGLAERDLQVRLRLEREETLGAVTKQLAERKVHVADLETGQAGDRVAVDLRLTIPAGVTRDEVLRSLGAIDGVTVDTSAELPD